MKKNLSLILLLVVLGFGCSHCSKTMTTFDGQTKGFNPYGDGIVNIVREAYWGNKKCIMKLVDRDSPKETVETPEEFPDLTFNSDKAKINTTEELIKIDNLDDLIGAPLEEPERNFGVTNLRPEDSL